MTVFFILPAFYLYVFGHSNPFCKGLLKILIFLIKNNIFYKRIQKIIKNNNFFSP